MSIFGTIMDKIFHHPIAAAASAPPVAPTPVGSAELAKAPAAQVAAAPVDVEAVLTAMAAGKVGGGGNWQISIVDLLKLLDLDSSLDARKQLADELGVHVGADGSAEENIALHKAVMEKLAANGGKVPAGLS